MTRTVEEIERDLRIESTTMAEYLKSGGALLFRILPEISPLVYSLYPNASAETLSKARGILAHLCHDGHRCASEYRYRKERVRDLQIELKEARGG